MINNIELLRDIRIEELPEPYCAIAELIGIEAALKLAETFGGTSLYFAKLDTLLAIKKYEKIKTEFTGFNHRDLAIKYNYSESRIRQILDVKIEKPPIQKDLF